MRCLSLWTSTLVILRYFPACCYTAHVFDWAILLPCGLKTLLHCFTLNAGKKSSSEPTRRKNMTRLKRRCANLCFWICDNPDTSDKQLLTCWRFKLWPHDTAIPGNLTNTAGLSVEGLSPRCRNIWFAHLSCRHMEGCVGSVGRRETWLHRACTRPDTHLVERKREWGGLRECQSS